MSTFTVEDGLTAAKSLDILGLVANASVEARSSTAIALKGLI
jgi:hypothetical protein